MEILVSVHYTVMILLLIVMLHTIGRFFINASKNATFEKFDKMESMAAMALCHIQLILGFILLFAGKYSVLFENMGETMKNSASREIAVEHPLTMLIAIILITIGYSKGKRKAEDKAKFKTIAIFYTIGLVLILIRIPWDRISG